jgi:hypothetical protein
MLEGDPIIRVASPTVRAAMIQACDQPLTSADIGWAVVKADDARNSAHQALAAQGRAAQSARRWSRLSSGRLRFDRTQ